MKVAILGAILLAFGYANVSFAGDDSKGVNYAHQLLLSMQEGLCDAVFQSELTDIDDQKTPQPSIQTIHACQYVSEMRLSGCAKVGSCLSYDQWTEANPGISPTLSRDAFETGLILHRGMWVIESMLESADEVKPKPAKGATIDSYRLDLSAPGCEATTPVGEPLQAALAKDPVIPKGTVLTQACIGM